MNEAFLFRLILVIGVLWLTEFIQAQLEVHQPVRKVITLVVLVVGILYLLFGSALPVLNL